MDFSVESAAILGGGDRRRSLVFTVVIVLAEAIK
jgi:hypothetical protein